MGEAVSEVAGAIAKAGVSTGYTALASREKMREMKRAMNKDNRESSPGVEIDVVVGDERVNRDEVEVRDAQEAKDTVLEVPSSP